MTLKKFSTAILTFCLALMALSGCDNDNSGGRSSRQQRSQFEDGESSNSRNFEASPIPPGTVEATDDQEIVQAQQSHRRNTEVSGLVVVRKLLHDDTVPPCHQKFLLELTNGTTVLVAHNSDLAPRVPVREGDQLVIHGVFIYNEKGGVIHWTHHSDSPRHESGYIDYNGARYQ